MCSEPLITPCCECALSPTNVATWQLLVVRLQVLAAAMLRNGETACFKVPPPPPFSSSIPP